MVMIYGREARETVLEKLNLVISLGRASNLEALAEAEISRLTEHCNDLKKSNAKLKYERDSLNLKVEEIKKDKSTLENTVNIIEYRIGEFEKANKISDNTKQLLKEILSNLSSVCDLNLWEL